MEGEPLKEVNSGEFLNIRISQDTESRQEINCGKAEALVSSDLPSIAPSIIMRRHYFVLEMELGVEQME